MKTQAIQKFATPLKDQNTIKFKSSETVQDPIIHQTGSPEDTGMEQPIFKSNLVLELFGYHFFQSWNWSLEAPEFFFRAGAGTFRVQFAALNPKI